MPAAVIDRGPLPANANDYGFQRLINFQRRRMTGATASCPETSFTFPLKSTQPLAKGRPRDAEAAAHCTRVAKTAIRLDPVASLALRAILNFLQQRKSFTGADDEAVGLWATRSVVHQVHSLPDPVK